MIVLFILSYLMFLGEADKALNPRIIGGEVASSNQFPYKVAIYVFKSFVCGGSIISSKWIITAAHCVDFVHPSQVILLYGTNINNFEHGYTQKALFIIIHEEFEEFKNDIALIKTRYPFEFQESIQPINLRKRDTAKGSDIVVIGWGQIYEDGPFPEELQWTVLKKVDEESCGFSVGFTDKIICLKHPENSICYGDSGTPAIFEGELIGIASFMIGGCGSMFPVGYVKINDYLHWIYKKLNDTSYDTKPFYL